MKKQLEQQSEAALMMPIRTKGSQCQSRPEKQGRCILCKDYTREMKVVEMMVRYEK